MLYLSSTQNPTMHIRPLTLEDASELYALVDISRASLKNLLWAQTATLESTQAFIAMKSLSQDAIYGVFDNHLVAVLELRQKPEAKELGYWVGTPYRGLGYMKKSVSMLLESQSDTVIAHIRQSNAASRKILESAGLVYSHTEIWQDEPWVHLKKV